MKIANKGLGFYFALISAMLAVAGLVAFFMYTGQGGTPNTMVIVATVAAIILDVTLLFGEQIYSDFTGVIASVLLAFALISTLQGGIGNIADQVNSIKMFGDAALANMNYTLVILYGLSMIAAICACFTKKAKT